MSESSLLKHLCVACRIYANEILSFTCRIYANETRPSFSAMLCQSGDSLSMVMSGQMHPPDIPDHIPQNSQEDLFDAHTDMASAITLP